MFEFQLGDAATALASTGAQFASVTSPLAGLIEATVLSATFRKERKRRVVAPAASTLEPWVPPPLATPTPAVKREREPEPASGREVRVKREAECSERDAGGADELPPALEAPDPLLTVKGELLKVLRADDGAPQTNLAKRPKSVTVLGPIVTKLRLRMLKISL
jgi:hypothetical protein